MSLSLGIGLGLTQHQSRAPLGLELITNGTFDADTDWTKGTTWTISGGVATSNGGGNFLQQDLISWSVTTYRVEYEIKNYVSGTVRARISTSNNGTTQSGNGVYTQDIVVSSTSDQIFNLIPTSLLGDIDNVSIKEVL